MESAYLAHRALAFTHGLTKHFKTQVTYEYTHESGILKGGEDAAGGDKHVVQVCFPRVHVLRREQVLLKAACEIFLSCVYELPLFVCRRTKMALFPEFLYLSNDAPEITRQRHVLAVNICHAVLPESGVFSGAVVLSESGQSGSKIF